MFIKDPLDIDTFFIESLSGSLMIKPHILDIGDAVEIIFKFPFFLDSFRCPVITFIRESTGTEHSARHDSYSSTCKSKFCAMIKAFRASKKTLDEARGFQIFELFLSCIKNISDHPACLCPACRRINRA